MKSYYIDLIEKTAKSIINPSDTPIPGVIDVDWSETADKATKSFKGGKFKDKVKKTSFIDAESGKKFGKGLAGDAVSAGKNIARKSTPFAAGAAGIAAAGYGAKKMYDASHSKNKDIENLLGSKKSEANGLKARRGFDIDFKSMSSGKDKSYVHSRLGNGSAFLQTDKDLAREYAKANGNEADYLKRTNQSVSRGKTKQNISRLLIPTATAATPFSLSKGIEYNSKKNIEATKNLFQAVAAKQNSKKNLAKFVGKVTKNNLVGAGIAASPLIAGITAKNILRRNAKKKYLESLSPEELNYVKERVQKKQNNYDKLINDRRR